MTQYGSETFNDNEIFLFIFIIVATFGIIILSSICIVTAVAVRMESVGLIISTQDSVGKNGEFF
jgi:lipopolysaccharide/colanic/teichoic acid biosynthesis glycosyltransferase